MRTLTSKIQQFTLKVVQHLVSSPVNLFGFTGSAVGLGANEKASASAILNENEDGWGRGGANPTLVFLQSLIQGCTFVMSGLFSRLISVLERRLSLREFLTPIYVKFSIALNVESNIDLYCF